MGYCFVSGHVNERREYDDKSESMPAFHVWHYNSWPLHCRPVTAAAVESNWRRRFDGAGCSNSLAGHRIWTLYRALPALWAAIIAERVEYVLLPLLRRRI